MPTTIGCASSGRSIQGARFYSALRKTRRSGRKISVPARSHAHFRCLGVEFESPLAGRHGVSNVLAAIATARALGIRAGTFTGRGADAGRRQNARRAFRARRHHRLSTTATMQIPKPCAPCWSCFGDTPAAAQCRAGRNARAWPRGRDPAPRHRTIRRGTGY